MGPDPESTGDPDNQKHGILGHEERENHRTTIVLEQTRCHIVWLQIEIDAVLLEPVVDPLDVRGLLIEVAADDNDGRYHIQYTEYSNSDHKLL